ncbi:hypothetical protein JL721_8410 [Aureococcus anophagefferens]|nr:hypothetical protein JL721_8410 [Aureococcus anophagefferens]
MGAAATTAKQPLAEVDIKNEIGVLYGEEAQQAFAAAKKGDVVAWPKAQAYAEAHGLLDPKAVLFKNLRQFKIAREQIEAIYDEQPGAVRDIPWCGEDLGDDWRQCALHGAPAETLDELYAVAEQAFISFAVTLTAACPDGAVVKLAPLKGLARAAAKARNEYAKNTAPATSWLFDIVRGSVMCATEDEIVRLYAALDADPRVDVVRTKNRFNPPCFNGFVFLLSNYARVRRRRYRDILMNVAVRVQGEAREIVHLCELQIHHAPIKQSEPMHKSHVTYEFFREYFLGNADAVERRLNMLCALPVDDAENVDDLVDRVLGSNRASDTKLLLELAELLVSIAELASAVRVREKVLEIEEREYGSGHRKVAGTLRDLGFAYGSLGDAAKKRDFLVRALAIFEREYGCDHVEVAKTLANLGDAYRVLGDNAKSRDVLERARVIEEREYGSDHVKLAITLECLGNTHGLLGEKAKARDFLERALAIKEREYAATTPRLGDAAKARELFERALAIKEREYGRDHVKVAITLGNLGNVYGDLGDNAKAREFLERALAIEEREYGSDHVDVAVTLTNLGNAHNRLGDAAKARELFERALAIKEREYGRDHVKVAITLGNLGNVYGDLGDNAKAREFLERALAIEEREYGSDHVEVAFTLGSLGLAYGVLGDAAKRRDLMQRTLAIFEREYGRDHPHAVFYRSELEG